MLAAMIRSERNGNEGGVEDVECSGSGSVCVCVQGVMEIRVTPNILLY
jgi:hypothetical protein